MLSRLRASRPFFVPGLVFVALVAAVNMTNGAQAVPASVKGTVFQDFNSDGTMDTAVAFGQATDVGIGGIAVKAFDSTGAMVGETTTGADGTYTLTVTGATSTKLRVEFEIPSSGPLAAMVTSFAGSGNGTSVQFVDVGASGVDFGVNAPGEFCQNNPQIAVVRLCHVGDTASLDADVKASPTLFLTNYDSSPYKSGAALTNGLVDWSTATKATESDTGSVLGLAYDNRVGVNAFYASAYVRRHTRMYESGGSPVPGALFKMTASGTSFLVDLEGLMVGDQFANSSSGQFGFIETNADRHVVTPSDMIFGTGAVAKDAGTEGVFEEVGAAGIGDIDMGDDGHLYIVSLYTKHLYKVAVPADGTAPSTMTDLGDITSSVTCTNGDPRPFGLQPWRGLIYLGVTCDGSGDVGTSDPDLHITANIVTVDPNAASPTFSAFITGIPLGAVGNVDTKGSTANNSGQSARWWPWLDSYSDANWIDSATNRAIRPVPMLSDIEFDGDGSIILAFRDRTGDQLSPIAGKDNPDGTNSTQSYSGGDIRRLCRTGTGYTSADYALDGQTGCPTNGTNQGVGEYYAADGFGGWHKDTGAGFTEQVPGFPDLLMTMFDPWDDGSTYGDSTFASGGVKYLLNSTGGADLALNAGGGVQYYTKLGATSAGSFRKVNGMADLEAACDSAPVQIGNRVWIDFDHDGIQDADETPVARVTVRVYDSTGSTLLGTAVTNSKGEYFFSSLVDEDAAGNADNVGGGIEPGKSYVIRFDNAADYASGGPLAGYLLTTQTSSDSVSNMDTSVDSNASTVNSYPQISTSTLRSGVNNHTFDVGFYDPLTVPTTTTTTTTSTSTTTPSGVTTTSVPTGTSTTTVEVSSAPKVSVGDYVWFDANRDGRQGSTEKGIKGVLLTITKLDGSPVFDVNRNRVPATRTDARGRYSFDNLPPGQYKVTITLPAGYTPTKAHVGTAATDSSTNSATSRDMATDGDRDPTLDFGVVLVGSLPETK